MPERSLYWKGHPFPVCARCTGVAFGQLLAIITGCFLSVPLVFALLCLSLMGLDWGLQEIKIKESNNFRRLFTGILGGFGLFSIYISIFKKLYRIITKRLTQS